MKIHLFVVSLSAAVFCQSSWQKRSSGVSTSASNVSSHPANFQVYATTIISSTALRRKIDKTRCNKLSDRSDEDDSKIICFQEARASKVNSSPTLDLLVTVIIPSHWYHPTGLRCHHLPTVCGDYWQWRINHQRMFNQGVAQDAVWTRGEHADAIFLSVSFAY